MRFHSAAFTVHSSHRFLPGRRDLNRCFLGPFDDVDGRRPHLERRWAELYGENNSPMGSAKLPVTWSVTPAPEPKAPAAGVA